MDPRDNGNGVAPSQPYPHGGRGEASSPWMMPSPQQQPRPIPPVLGWMPQIPTVDLWDEPQMRTLDPLYSPGAQRYVDVGRGAAFRPLEAPPPPSQIPPPHQQFGLQQPRYRWSEAYSSGGHVSSFDAGADARRLARNSRANPYTQPPVAALLPPMAPWSHTANSSTSQQLYAMDARAWIDASGPPHPAYIPSTNFDMVPHGDPSSSRQQAPLQQRYAAPTWPQPPQPPIHLDPRLEVVLSQLRHNNRMTPESSALVVKLLQEGVQAMPQLVLDEFVHYAMGNRQAFAVLLRSLRGRHVQLEQIVRAVPNLVHKLVWTSDDGMAVLKLLIMAVRSQPGLPEQLVYRFVEEGVMEQDRGNELIVHCFVEMGYEASKFLITHALRTIWHMLESSAGSARLFTCYWYARHEERQHFMKFMLSDGNAARMARGRHSNFFVQRVIDHGDGEFRHDLVLELMREVASLSLDQYGSYVVEHCFRNWVDLLPLVLMAFTNLGRRDLEELVQTRPGNIVLAKLLDTGYDHCRELTRGLANKIHRLISPSPWSEMVLKCVRRVRYG